MGLVELASQLATEAEQGTVLLQATTLTGNGLTPAADFDTRLAAAFQLEAVPLSITSSKDDIGTPTSTQLTMTGSLTAWNVTVNPVTVTFTGADHVVVTISAPLGKWSFSTSWPPMLGFPFDELALQTPTFVFASEAVTPYSWNSTAATLAAGLNFLDDVTIAGPFAPLLTLLPAAPTGSLLLSGTVDPSVIDGTTLGMPNVELSASLLNAPLPPVGPLQLENAAFGVEVATTSTLTGPAQYTDASLLTTLDFGKGEPILDCRVSITAGSDQVTLLLSPDPKGPAPSIEALFDAMGGQAWYSVVPGPLQSFFTSFEFTGLRAVMDASARPPKLLSVGLSVGSKQSWTIIDSWTVGQLELDWHVDDPLGSPESQAQIGGMIQALSVFEGGIYVSVTSDMQISAMYSGSMKLSQLIADVAGTSVTLPAHMDIELTELDLMIDEPRKAYSLYAAGDAQMDVLGTGTLQMGMIEASLANAADGTQATLNGSLILGSTTLELDVEYQTGTWHFEGGLAQGSSIPLGELIDSLLNEMGLPDFLPSDLAVAPLWFTADVPATGASSFGAKAGVTWTLANAGVLTGTSFDAELDLAYDGDKQAYTGSASGETKLPVIGADVIVKYAFAPGNDVLSLEWKGFAEAQYMIATDTIVFTVEAKSLGELLAEIIGFVEDEPDFSLPAPWDLLNDIPLKGFEVTWNLKPKLGDPSVSVTYPFNSPIDLYFVQISQVVISSIDGKVKMGLTYKLVTDGAFHTDTFDPQTPPAVKGEDTSKFELDLLALGQHVTVDGLADVTSVDGAITLLESFAPPTNPNSVPVAAKPGSGQPVYAPDSQWLVGTRFKVLVDKSVKPSVALLDLEAVFNDPILYGLRVVLGGPKAGVLGGLDFEIMYRKVSDTIGVYEIELKLPDWARHMEFGEVSITLPIIGVDVYTNGDFRIDFGFPANMDFSRSFGVEAFPFTGAGGFYFGVLSNATAPNLPATTLGRFDPVIVFGIGLQLGLGKSIDEGIFSAQMSVTVYGIVEGVVAPWHPYDPPQLAAGTAMPAVSSSAAFDDVYYYWLRGTIGIVATVVGEVNFAIISASVNVTAQAFVQITIEAHKAIPVHMEAGVSVAITVRINCGLFTISIHLSFSLTITADFTIGSDSSAPWNPSQLAADAVVHELAAAAPADLPVRSFTPLVVEDKQTLTVYAAPHLTLADYTGSGGPEAAYVVNLYMDGPVGQPVDAVSSFETLAFDTLLWAIASFGEEPTEGLRRADAVTAGVTLAQATDALAYFTADGAASPVPYSSLRDFLSTHFTITVQQPAAGDHVESAVALPVLPDLVLDVPAWKEQPAQTIDFTANAMCTPGYLTDLQNLLQELAVDLETDLQRKYATAPKAVRSAEPPTQSLATFVFEDYFALLCRHMLQAAVDNFGTYSQQLQAGQSLDAIIAQFDPANALTPAAVGAANVNLPLAPAAPLTLNGVTHAVLTTDTLNGIAGNYGVTALLLATLNEELEGLLVTGQSITVGQKPPYKVGPHDTLASVATATTGSLQDVVTAIGALTGALVPLAVIQVPTFTHAAAAAGTDTLATVAATYGVTVAQLATDNAGVGPLFATTSTTPTFASVPGLTVLTAAQIGDVLHRAQVYANLAGISTRFVMNGLRLPVNSNITVAPGTPCAGQTSCGLQALIGQQVTLPTLADSDAGNYTLTLTQGSQGTWIGFAPGPTSLPLTIDAAQIDIINGVLGAAPAFAPQTLSIAALPETTGVARRFVLPTPIPLQLPAALTLPNGAPSSKATAFPLPDGLLTVLAQPAARPGFSLQLGTPRNSGGMAMSPAQSFGWATLVTVTVKRRAPGAATPMSAGTYELVGTDATGIVLLERVLQTAGETGTPVASVQLLYPPNNAAPLSAGLQGGDPATVSTFIVQANLSTATSPQGGAVATEALMGDAAQTAVHSDPTTFVRMLWECSIVQSGGYSLYYEASQGSPGLPDHVFDASGRGELQLVVLHTDASNGIGAYANAAVIGDPIDTTHTTVLAQSEPLAVTLHTQQVESLASLATQVHLTPSELAVALADVPLALGTGASVQIAGALYETRFGDTIDAIAQRFQTTATAIEALNSGLQISWTDIPPWTILEIPPVEYALAAGATFSTLREIATNFCLSLPALGALNQSAPIFPAGALALTDEIVDATAVLPPGAGGFTLTRQQPAEQQPTDPVDPAVYLESNFHLLGYQLAENPGFTGGPAGLPVGPADPLDPDQLATLADDHPPPPPQSGPVTLYYQHLLPLAAHAKYNPLAGTTGHVPPGTANPYAGIGYAAQPSLEWRDLFGNRAHSPLSDPALDPTGPQNQPPVWMGYSDKLLGVAQWPSISTEYSVASGPQLGITLSFDVSRYAGAASAGPAQQAALTDRQTYAQIYYQLNQTRPDGSPHVTIGVSTSLDGGTVHELSGANLSNVQGLALSAWQYLDGLLAGTVQPLTNPITAAVSLPVADTNAADIFQLTVALTLARDPSLVADASRDEAGVATAATPVPPQLDGGNGGTASLLLFATSFEAAFEGATTQLKLGVGDSREGAAGAAEARLLWAVRTSSDQNAGIACELTGAAVFWAPPPLSTAPISRNNVQIWPLDANGNLDPSNPSFHNYTNVDLDVWAREALGAIDQFLSPEYDVPTFVVDSRAGTTYLDRLRTAKTTLASSIASTVQNVLTTPAKPADPAQTEAQSKWEQQLLVTLGSAYTVDVAVQFPVAVRCEADGNYEPPALYGHVALPPVPSGTVAPPYSLSSFKVPAVEPSSYLTFLFTANDPGESAYAELDLTYCLDQIEHQIGPVPGVDGYKASTWLTFPIALPPVAFSNPDLSTVQIPIVLRAYPDPPTLNAQTATQAIDQTNAKTIVDTATEWTYVATYSEQHFAQDVTEATAALNIAPSGFGAQFGVTDVFPPLARLIALIPQLQASFDAGLAQITTATDPTGQQFAQAKNAVGAFTTLVEDLAAAWPRVSNTVRPLDKLGVPATATEFSFTIAESPYPPPKSYPPPQSSNLLVTVALAEGSSLPAGVPAPVLDFTGYSPVATDGGVRYQAGDGSFLGWYDALAMPGRSVAIGPVEVFGVQNAQLGVRLKRNGSLVPRNPTLDPFVYTTPLVKFASIYTPLLSVSDPIDVAAIRTGTVEQKTLVEHLETLFSEFFSAARGTQTIKLEAGYSYAVDAQVPAASAIAVEVPIGFVPSATFVLPDDLAANCPNPVVADSPFVCRLAQVIREWVATNQPTADASLTFDVAAYSTLAQTTLPLIDLSNFFLRRADITDL